MEEKQQKTHPSPQPGAAKLQSGDAKSIELFDERNNYNTESNATPSRLSKKDRLKQTGIKGIEIMKQAVGRVVSNA